MRELTHSKILANNHVYKIKSNTRYIHSRFIIETTRFALNGIIFGHVQKHSGTFCNGVVVLVSAHQFRLFFKLVIKTSIILFT